MKCKVCEHGGRFSITLDAETMEDAAFLTRFGMNKTKELQGAYAFCRSDNTFAGAIMIGKRKQFSSEITGGK